MSCQIHALIIPKEILNINDNQIIYLYPNMTYGKIFLFRYKNYNIYQNKEDLNLKPYIKPIKEFIEIFLNKWKL